jgi:predicted transcriptional regulator
MNEVERSRQRGEKLRAKRRTKREAMFAAVRAGAARGSAPADIANRLGVSGRLVMSIAEMLRAQGENVTFSPHTSLPAENKSLAEMIIAAREACEAHLNDLKQSFPDRRGYPNLNIREQRTTVFLPAPTQSGASSPAALCADVA